MNPINTPADDLIYREELAPKLPKRIFDAHVHIWKRNCLPADFVFGEKAYERRFDCEFDLPAFHRVMNEILPEQEVWINCFGLPRKDSDRDNIPTANGVNEFANVLISPADSPETLIRRLDKSHAVGVKPYLNYPAEFYNKKPGDVEVAEMLTPGQLEVLNARKRTVTLHIPRSGRFADKLNQRQMIDLCAKYPDITFIFAHIGRAYFMRNILESNLDEFVQYPNAYFDTAMVNSTDVLRYTFDHFPADRVLFATDSPIALLHGKSVEINHQYAYLMADNYAIGTTINDVNHAVRFTTFYYEQLRAILDAAPAQSVQDVLFNNSQKLFTKVQAL